MTTERAVMTTEKARRKGCYDNRESQQERQEGTHWIREYYQNTWTPVP